MHEVRPKTRQRSSRRARNWKWSLYLLYFVAAGLLLAGGLAVYRTRPAAPVNANKELISVGQGFVRGEIREDYKINFSGEEETRVEHLPDNKYLISGWVDIISPAGVTDRQIFTCIIYKGPGNAWVGEKVAVIPQTM